MQVVFTMKILFVYFVVVLLISGKSAIPVQSQDNIEASGEIESVVNNEDIKVLSESVKNDELKQELKKEDLNSVIEIPEEVNVETVKRSKKSEYPSAPCAPCGGYNAPNQYSPPSVAYNFQPSGYGPPLNSGYSAPQSGYGQPIYHRSPRPSRKRYGRPSYQQPQPSYQSPPVYHQAPAYSAPGYAAPAPSYNQPSYSASSYSNQAYLAPSYPSPAQSYSYQSPAPSVPCTTNIVVGCQPHVQEVPCSGYSSSYSAPPAQGSSQPQTQYRTNYHDELPVSSAQPPTTSTNDLKPEKDSSADKTPSKPKTTESKDTVALSQSTNTDESEKNSANDNTTNGVNNQQKDSTDKNNHQAKELEESKTRHKETLATMSQFSRTPDMKNQNQQLGSIANDQQQHQQEHQHQQHPNVHQPNLPQHLHQNSQQNMSPLTSASFSGPPPTSMNYGMNVGASNQVNSQYSFPIPSQQWT